MVRLTVGATKSCRSLMRRNFAGCTTLAKRNMESRKLSGLASYIIAALKGNTPGTTGSLGRARIKQLTSVSVYTGLRISDVSRFHIDRLQPTGEIRMRTTKGGARVYTSVPEWLQERIRARALAVGPYVFGDHSTADMNVVAVVWRRKLNKLWDAL